LTDSRAPISVGAGQIALESGARRSIAADHHGEEDGSGGVDRAGASSAADILDGGVIAVVSSVGGDGDGAEVDDGLPGSASQDILLVSSRVEHDVLSGDSGVGGHRGSSNGELVRIAVCPFESLSGSDCDDERAQEGQNEGTVKTPELTLGT